MRTQRWVLSLLIAMGMAITPPAQSQDQDPNQAAPPSGGWRRFGGSGPGAEPLPAGPPSAQAPASAWGQLTVPAGAWITVRLDEPLSSDHNQPGDFFTATLAQPVVAGGRILARRGQTAGGAVAEAVKAGRAQGTSRLGIEITELTLADGRRVNVKTSIMQRQGGTSVGRDAGAIATATGIGAAIGAAADGGFGAGMGAIAGAAASTIGVLVTRGRATEVYPENLLTFRLETPVTVEGPEAAFPPVTQQDYEQQTTLQPRPSLYRRPPPAYYPYPYYYPPTYYGGVVIYNRRGGFRRW